MLLVDLQHPHDFFAQIAGSWEKALSPELRLRFYGAVVGEPAMGPPAYVHRRSAMENPTTPLSHHNQDSTHISYDVLTLGLASSTVTLEGSAFHGAEPDENRWNIQAGAIDSYSGRLTVDAADGLDGAGFRGPPDQPLGGRAGRRHPDHGHAGVRDGAAGRRARGLAHHGP